MDYKDAGAIKKGSNKPRHSEHNAKGSRKNPFGKSEGKAELLARMKAAAQARQNASQTHRLLGMQMLRSLAV
mgnify:CR=1 FL=1